MQILLHGNLTAAVGEALRRHGHSTHEVAELEIGEQPGAAEVIAAAGKRQWDILTADAALTLVPYDQGIVFGRSIMFLQLEGGDVEQDDAIDRLFERYRRLTPGRLYTVTGTRVKVRQLPTRRLGPTE